MVIVGGIIVLATVRLNCFEAVPPELMAFAVKVLGPAALGVPAIAPVDELSERPAGSEPGVIVQVIGPDPVAPRVCGLGCGGFGGRLVGHGRVLRCSCDPRAAGARGRPS